MARKRDEDNPEKEAKRERRRAASEKENAPPSDKPTSSKRGSITGYDYSGWGTDSAQKGGRPPNKADWDHMSQEEREAIGYPTFESLHAAQKNWRAGFGKGGGNYQSQSDLRGALKAGGARSFEDVLRIAAQSGYLMKPDHGQALLKRLKMAFEGSSDPSGRYHFDSDGNAIDVSTSDMSKRGIAGRADFSGPRLSGIEAVLAGLKGGDEDAEAEYFQRTVASGDWTEWPPGSGNYFNDPGNDATRRVWKNGMGQDIQAPGAGPNIDYSKFNQNQTSISDYLKGQGILDANMAQHNQNAANAAPITFPQGNNGNVNNNATTPGAGWGSSGSMPNQVSNFAPQASNFTQSTPAWGAGFGSQMRTKSQVKPMQPKTAMPSLMNQPSKPKPMAATGFGGFGAY